MKTILFCVFVLGSHLVYGQDPLKKFTIGLGTGYNYLFQTVDDYSLTTDTVGRLEFQPLSRHNFVVSSIIVFRLGARSVQSGTNSFVAASSSTWDRFAICASVNLFDFSSNDVSFNKSIDGGIGFGYFINPSLQIAAFYELARIRQLRQYIKNDYMNAGIPDGEEFFNALDEKDSRLFYTKTFSSVSVKLIFALPNKE